MKKFTFLLVLVLIVISCSKSEDENPLKKNLSGNELTKEFCIDLVRNHWDCNMGAKSTYMNKCETSVYGHTNYSCYQGDMGEIINEINYLFDSPGGINKEKCYYKNYILYLENKACCTGCPNSVEHTVTVNF